MNDTHGHHAHEDLVPVDLGPMKLLAPDRAPRHVRGEHGDLWQWIGSGRDLITLTVAVRTTQLGTPRGVRDHALWEANRLVKSFDNEFSDPIVTEFSAYVFGSIGTAAAIVDGVHSGIRTHNRIVVATDGQYMHVVQAMVPDTGPGRSRSTALVDDLAITQWKEPRE